MELDQKYIDVVIKCWQQYARKQAVLEGDGRTTLPRYVAAEFPPIAGILPRKLAIGGCVLSPFFEAEDERDYGQPPA